MSVNIYLWIYVVISIGIVFGGTYKIYDMGQSLAALLFFIGSTFLCITYGLRWFGAKSSIFSNTPVQWPTTINTCPDFLTYYKRSKLDGTFEETCIDLVGVSSNGVLKPFPKNNSGPVDSTPSSDDYYFSLKTSSSDPIKKNNELCQRAMINGLTWEGVTNGESCINPDGSVGPNNPSGNPNCPPPK